MKVADILTFIDMGQFALPVPVAPYRLPVGREAHGTCPPAAVAGEDAGAPCWRVLADRASAPWSAGVLAGLRRTFGPIGRRRTH